jgi:hypothetical protein
MKLQDMTMIEFQEAQRTVQANRPNRWFPDVSGQRLSGGLLFPSFKPKFRMPFANSNVFTIDFCFAQNIEEVLTPRSVQCPTINFLVRNRSG